MRSLIGAAPRSRLWVAGFLPGAAAASFFLASSVHGDHSVLVMVLIALAAAVSSIAGFAFSALCGAMLFHVTDDPVRVVQVMITCSIANQAAMTWATRADIDWRRLLPFLAGGAFGLAPGVWVLMHVNRGIYTHAFGVFLVLYGITMLVRRPIVIGRRLRSIDVACGLLGGITGAAAAFPGAFASIWCGMQGWNKLEQRAVVQPFILIMQVAALVAIGFARHAGSVGPAFDSATILFIPASLLGTTLGMTVFRRITDSQFTRAVNVLLVVSGVSYAA